MTQKPSILLIYTGGTIGMVKDYQSGALKAFNFDKLMEQIPELNHLNCTINSVSFDTPIDSSEMNIMHWQAITSIIEDNYAQYDGFVVLHGSDTMAYTASALSFMLLNLRKPVILTGSQLPIGDLRTDAKENLITSIEIAATQNNGIPVVQEVGLYFEYKLYRGNRTTKVSSEHFEAFSSPNYPPLAESGVHLKFDHNHLLKPLANKSLKVFTKMSNEIIVLKIFPGMPIEVLESLFNNSYIRGILLETYGAGNAPTSPWFLDLIKKAIDRNVVIVDVTQCVSGSVSLGHYETSVGLSNLGVISGRDITTEAALTKLMYLLGGNKSVREIKEEFENNLCGEIS